MDEVGHFYIFTPLKPMKMKCGMEVLYVCVCVCVCVCVGGGGGGGGGDFLRYDLTMSLSRHNSIGKQTQQMSPPLQ